MALKLAEAYVVIKAELDQLRSGLKKSMSMVKSTMSSISSAMKSVASSIVKYTKRAMLALIGLFTYATYAAGKQEAAEFELAAALKVIGKYTDALIQKYKRLASEIQNVTTYGDEDILTFMRLGLTLGVTTDKIEEATKAAISLAAFGGRMKPEMAMRYYAQALEGITSSLETYIPTMRSVTTYEEKMVKLNEGLASGWAIATAKSHIFFGSIAQMKNAIGDLVEKIGAPFTPMLTETAHKIRDWAKQNEAIFGKWAEKIAAYYRFVKSTFMEFVRYLKTDWIDGIVVALDFLASSFVLVAKNVKLVFERIFSDVANQFGILFHRIADSLMAGGEISKVFSELFSIISGQLYEFSGDHYRSWDTINKQLRANVREYQDTLKALMPEELTATIVDKWAKMTEELNQINQKRVQDVREAQEQIEEAMNPKKAGVMRYILGRGLTAKLKFGDPRQSGLVSLGNGMWAMVKVGENSFQALKRIEQELRKDKVVVGSMG